MEEAQCGAGGEPFCGRLEWPWRTERLQQTTLPTSPHPRRRLSSNIDNCATLTIHWHKDRAIQDVVGPLRNRTRRLMFWAVAARKSLLLDELQPA